MSVDGHVPYGGLRTRRTVRAKSTKRRRPSRPAHSGLKIGEGLREGEARQRLEVRLEFVLQKDEPPPEVPVREETRGCLGADGILGSRPSHKLPRRATSIADARRGARRSLVPIGAPSLLERAAWPSCGRPRGLPAAQEAPDRARTPEGSGTASSASRMP